MGQYVGMLVVMVRCPMVGPPRCPKVGGCAGWPRGYRRFVVVGWLVVGGGGDLVGHR